MSGFPLYDNLVKDLPKKDLTAQQKLEFVNNIDLIDESGKELIYALIQFFNITNKTENLQSTDILPFKGVKNETESDNIDIYWCLSDFPIKLRCLLYKFVIMHLKTIQEESDRKDQSSNSI
mgnify:CR=1 FL=1|tara:strand:+ start:321 stop:683 length:363 start_codon:yes stop_codon:yes gene_type:complete